MGVSSSIPVERYNPKVPYFALIFRRSDEIRLIMASSRVCEIVRRACQTVDPETMRFDSKCEKGWHRFQFRGFPFSTQSPAPKALLGRQLATRILFDLCRSGFTLVLSTRMSVLYNNTNWYFTQAVTERPPLSMICISISHYDSLSLIGCNESLFEMLVRTCKKTYGRGVTESSIKSSDVAEIKLRGRPWHTSDEQDSVDARRLLLAIVEQMHRRQYRLYGTADLKDTADSMFFGLDTDSNLVNKQFFCMSLNAENLLRLINCNDDVLTTVTEAVRLNWRDGLTKVAEMNLDGDGRVWELSLGGHPWYSGGSEAVEARSLICSIFEMLLSRGWCVLTALDVSRNLNDKTVFIFRNCAPAFTLHSCLGFFDKQYLTVIRGDGLLLDIVRQTAVDNYAPGVATKGDYKTSQSLVFTGSPYLGTGGNDSRSMHMAVLQCHWLNEFHNAGRTVVCSADVSARFFSAADGAWKLDPHSWFLAISGSKRGY